jgi:MFS family permease
MPILNADNCRKSLKMVIIALSHVLQLFLGMLLSLFLTDRLGRKFLLLISGIGDAICLCVLAWSFDELGKDSELSNSEVTKFLSSWAET